MNQVRNERWGRTAVCAAVLAKSLGRTYRSARILSRSCPSVPYQYELHSVYVSQTCRRIEYSNLKYKELLDSVSFVAERRNFVAAIMQRQYWQLISYHPYLSAPLTIKRMRLILLACLGRSVSSGSLLWMPFGMMSGIGRGMGILDGGGDRRRGKGSFGGEFGASHCNQCDATLPKLLWARLVLMATHSVCRRKRLMPFRYISKILTHARVAS